MRIKTLCIAIAFMTVTLPVGGCGTDSTQRVALLQAAIAQIEQQSKALDAKIIQVEGLLAANEKLLSDPNATGPVLDRLWQENADLQAKLAAAKPVKALFDQKLTTYRAALSQAIATGSIDPNKEAELYGKGIQTIGGALPPPWNIYATLAGGLITTFGGAIGGAIARGRKAKVEVAQVRGSAERQMNDATRLSNELMNDEKTKRLEAESAIEGLVISVDELLKSGSAAVTNAGTTTAAIDPDKAKNILMRAQASTPEAIAAVQRVRAEQQKTAAV